MQLDGSHALHIIEGVGSSMVSLTEASGELGKVIECNQLLGSIVHC